MECFVDTGKPPGAEPTILIVDDDALARKSVRATLATLGLMDIIEASTGLEALQLLDGYEGDVDLVICDLEMPEFDGLDLMRELGNLDSGCNLLVCSGHREDILDSALNFARSVGLTVIGAHKKPLRRQTLADALEKVHRRIRAVPRESLEISEDFITSGLQHGAVEVFFQPKIRLSDHSISGYEALLRWRDGESYLPPYPIIRFAEQSGHIREITSAVIDRVLFHCRQYPADRDCLNVAINISADDFVGRDFTHILKQRCEASGMLPRQITLEMTETQIDNDLVSTENVTRLSFNGFRSSIDDFGSGMSNLSRLAKLPFRELKLDREFIINAQGSFKYRAALENAIRLASEIGVDSVGEGVETFEQLIMLTEVGCTHAQGYLIAKPMHYDDMLDFNRKWASLPFHHAVRERRAGDA